MGFHLFHTHMVLPSQVRRTVLVHKAQEDSALGPRKMF